MECIGDARQGCERAGGEGGGEMYIDKLMKIDKARCRAQRVQFPDIKQQPHHTLTQ